ncbi:hypothetical protein JCM1840_001972 [Sporobolomyces johnsonii]
MLPPASDFPDQQELAEEVLQRVRDDLARRPPQKPPFSSFDELKYFRREADLAGLHLPFKWADILNWRENIEGLLHCYSQLAAEPSTLRPLLYRIRAVIRSERYKYATKTDRALVALLWGLVEEKNGNRDEAKAAWEWALENVVGENASHGLERAGMLMEGCLARAAKKEGTDAELSAALDTMSTSPVEPAIESSESAAGQH